MKKGKIAMISAVFTALLSTLCCIPALFYIIFGFSSGLFAYFIELDFIRIPLAILTFILIFFILMQTKKSCECTTKNRYKKYMMTSIFILFIIFMLFYPELIPYIME